jgi:hypothetical protein
VKLKLFLLVAFCLWASASRAQSSNCAQISYVKTGDVQTINSNGYVVSESVTYQVTCTNTNNNTSQTSNNTDSATGEGGQINNCYSNCSRACPPYFSINSYQSGTTSANSYFQQWAYSKVLDVSSGNCYNGNTTVATTYCNAIACAPPPCSPVGSPPYCGSSDVPSWDTNSCQWTCVPNPNNSPILIDVSGNGFQLTGAGGGVSYDISGTGAPVQIAWTAAGAQNAFLCLPDAYGNCNSGKQLFGNFTPQPKSSTPNGFAALAVYDTTANGGNGDGVIDARDAIFSSLRLWIDANHDGLTQPNELFTLPQLGITSISLNYKWDQRADQYGNVFRYRAQVGSTPGVGRMAYDVFFVTQTNTNTAKGGCPLPKVLARPSGK